MRRADSSFRAEIRRMKSAAEFPEPAEMVRGSAHLGRIAVSIVNGKSGYHEGVQSILERYSTYRIARRSSSGNQPSELRITVEKLLGKCATSRPLSFQRSNRFVDHGFRLTFLERDR